MQEASSIDPHYQGGDICLRSSDGVVFWPFKQYLLAYSRVFKDMLEIPQPKESNLSQPIDMDLPPDLLRIFLDLFSSSGDIELKTSFSDTQKLYNACQIFDCSTKVSGAVRTRLYVFGDSAPWDLLIFAGENADRSLASAALARMTPEKLIRGSDKHYQYNASVGFSKSLGDLPYSWRGEIMYAVLDTPTSAMVDRKDQSFAYSKSGKTRYVQEIIRQQAEVVLPFKENWLIVSKMFEKGCTEE